MTCVPSDLYDLVDKQTQTLFVEPTLVNHSSRLLSKEPSLPINELHEKNVKPGESKLSLHPLPKHSDPRQHSQHNKSKKVLKSDRLLEHNGEKNRQLDGLSPKTQVTGAATSHNHNHTRTLQRTNQESQSNLGPVQQVEAEAHPNSRARLPSQLLPPPPPPPPPPSPRKEPVNRRMDPEENRPGKSSFYQPVSASRNNSRPPAVFNQRSSLLYQLDILRRGWSFSPLMHTDQSKMSSMTLLQNDLKKTKKKTPQPHAHKSFFVLENPKTRDHAKFLCSSHWTLITPFCLLVVNNGCH